jgi:hypothetical protein
MSEQSSLVTTFALCKPRPDFSPPLPSLLSNHFITAVQPKINCYTWALACPGIGWGIPGSLAKPEEGFISTHDTLSLRKLLLEDGLVEIDRRTAFDPAFHVISLRFRDDDFHFYVRCADGTWSHKPGAKKPRNRDREWQIIYDPENLCQPDYPTFGGYYAIPYNGIQVYVRRPEIADYDLAEAIPASHCTM